MENENSNTSGNNELNLVTRVDPNDAQPTTSDPVVELAVPPVSASEAVQLDLSDPQRVAIARLTAGACKADAALAAGVTRMTLYRWLHHDPRFQAAYNAWQKDMITTAQANLLSHVGDALASVVNAIRNGDSRLGWKLLESQGITTRPAPGSTDVDELQRKAELAERKKQLAEKKERSEIRLGEISVIDLD